jgi:hypothetical protein
MENVEGEEMKNDNPSGELMLSRNLKHYEQVKSILPEFPSTRGDDTELWITMIRKYYWRWVRITQEKKGGALTIVFPERKNLYYMPSMESARRRRQELQASERKRIWNLIASKHGDECKVEDWQETDWAKKEFAEEVKTSKYLPTMRTIRKRERNEIAQRRHFIDHQETL